MVPGAPGGIRTPGQELRRLLLCPLSYGGAQFRAGEGNRTLVASLEGWSSASELHPLAGGRNCSETSTDRGRWLSRTALFCWLRAVAQLGSALALGARGRRFESGQPDHRNVSNRAPCIERVFGHTFPLRWTYGDPGASFGKSEPVGRATTARKGRAGTFTPTSRTLLWRDMQGDPRTKGNPLVLVEEHPAGARAVRGHQGAHLPQEPDATRHPMATEGRGGWDSSTGILGSCRAVGRTLVVHRFGLVLGRRCQDIASPRDVQQ